MITGAANMPIIPPKSQHKQIPQDQDNANMVVNDQDEYIEENKLALENENHSDHNSQENDMDEPKQKRNKKKGLIKGLVTSALKNETETQKEGSKKKKKNKKQKWLNS